MQIRDNLVLDVKDKRGCEWDLASLGEVLLRLDRFRAESTMLVNLPLGTARAEYNGAAKCEDSS